MSRFSGKNCLAVVCRGSRLVATSAQRQALIERKDTKDAVVESKPEVGILDSE